MSFFQAILIGALRGITELFPVSSLGHSVLVPAWLGWDSLVSGQSADESFYLAFLVGLHVATAIALLIFFRKDWARIIRGFLTSVRHRRIETSDQRMAWLLVIATVLAVGSSQIAALFAGISGSVRRSLVERRFGGTDSVVVIRRSTCGG